MSYASLKDPGSPTSRRYNPLPAALYCTAFLVVLWTTIGISHFAASVDGQHPTMYSCRAMGFSPGRSCGLDGVNCLPFTTDYFAIRCPPRCTWNRGSSLTVIGTGTYMGNSRICKAAIHAGVIGSNGGCALMRYSGEQFAFEGSEQNGVVSMSFQSWFPKSFEFRILFEL